MLQNIVEYIANLVKNQLEEMIQEIIEKVLELLNADQSIVDEWLDSLSPVKRMIAEQILNLVEDLLQLVADELVKE